MKDLLDTIAHVFMVLVIFVALGWFGMTDHAKGCYKSIRNGTALDQVDDWAGVETSTIAKEKHD